MSTVHAPTTRTIVSAAREVYTGPAAEQCQLLAQQLGLGPGLSTERRLLGITSIARRAGTSTIAHGLAATVAGWSAREVLLVDAHHAHSAYATASPVSPGLTEVCLGQQDLSQVVVPTATANLLFLPSGVKPQAALTVDALLCESAERFDHVMVDLPPLESCHPMLALLAALDGVVLVIESDRESRASLGTARELLERLKVPLVGAVLNKYRNPWPRWLRCWT